MAARQRALKKNFTLLLNEPESGDTAIRQELWAAIYDELVRIAESRFRSVPPGKLVDIKDIVHEAYLVLLESDATWESRRHFYRVAVRIVRNLIVTQIRRESRLKRGGGWRRVTLSEAVVPSADAPVDWLSLDEALSRLEARSPEQHEVVTLRFFSGLSIDEVARVLAVSPSTVDRQWRFARAWLLRELEER